MKRTPILGIMFVIACLTGETTVAAPVIASTPPPPALLKRHHDQRYSNYYQYLISTPSEQGETIVMRADLFFALHEEAVNNGLQDPNPSVSVLDSSNVTVSEQQIFMMVPFLWVDLTSRKEFPHRMGVLINGEIHTVGDPICQMVRNCCLHIIAPIRYIQLSW